MVECTTAETDGSYEVPFDWTLKPSGLAVGTKFRLLFVTSTTGAATSADIATYNTNVQTLVKNDHHAMSDSCGNLFKVVGSTSSVDARVNTDTESTDTDAAIYWMTGAKAADNYADFYDGSWDSGAGHDEGGSSRSAAEVWTGSNADGTKAGSNYLGAANVRQGQVATGSPLDGAGTAANSGLKPFFALSPVFTVAAKPVLRISIVSSRNESQGVLTCSTLRHSGTITERFPVNLRISQTGDFLAAGEAGDKTFSRRIGSTGLYAVDLDDDAVDEPNGSATCTLLPGSGYTVGSPNSGTTTIIDDDPTIASLIATSDVTFTEQVATDTAAVTVRLSRRLYAGEQLAVPIDYVGAEGIDAHDETDRDYALSVSGNGATGANLTSDIFYVQFTGHDTDIVQEATVTLTPTNNGDADTDDGYIELGISAVTADWTDSSFTNVGGGGERHATQRLVRLTYRDDDLTLTLSIPDDLAVEDDVDNEAQIRVALSRALVSGETVTVPLNFAGASRPADFNLLLGSNFTGVSLSGSTVTFTGPSVAAATMNVLAVSDSTDDDETVTVSLGTVTSTGVTVNRETTVNSQIRLLETAPYTPSPGPPLVIVDSITPIGGSCTGRECEITEAPAGSDIIINVRLVRPALEKGVGFIPVAATEDIAVNAYLQPGVHAHQWLAPPTFAVGEKIKTWLLRMSPSTLVESDVRRMLMFSGPVGSWGEGNPPPFGVVTNDPYWITIKDGPDGNAGTITPIVTVWHTHWQKLDGLYEGEAAGFEVRSASAAQVPFEVYLKVEETSGQCVDDALERTHRVSFAPGVPAVAFSVPTVDDGDAEQGCTVKVSLARADGTVPGAGTTTPVLTGGRGGYIIDKTNDARLGGARTHRADATATVRDDESVARKVFFVTGTRQVRESTAGTVNLEVAVEPAPGAPLDLRFSLSGTATRGADYTVPATVTVPMGATRATIPVTIVDDSHEDSGELVTVRLLASGGYAVLPPRHVSLLILNHDPDGGAPDWTDHRTVVNFLVQVRDNPANAAMKGNAAHIAKWNRVLAAIGHASPEQPMPASEIHANAQKWPDSPFKAASVYLTSLERQDPREPEIAVSAGSAVTEGGDAVFTLTASPAPAADLAVSVTVAADGDWGITAGSRTVTIPTSGSATLTLATAGDDADEPDGSVSVTVAAGTGYTVGSSASGTVSVRDDDDAAPPVAAVDPALVAEVRAMAEQTQHGAAHVKRWRRVLVAFGVEEYPGLTPTTLAEAKANAQKYSSPLWPRIAEALEKLAAAQQDQDQPQQQTPEIAVTANAAAVTEGGDAVFTLTATPAPAADLAVSVTVATDGDWGVAAGTQTVTIPTTGSATLTLATAGDDADEPDGSVTVTVADGSGYTVGSAGSGTVAVRDDDDPALPVVTLAAGTSPVTEGGDAVFTLTASPAPAADLAVSVSVAADGDWGVTAGTQTVTIPTTGSATLTLATTDDAADEPDGSVTATVQAGSGYTVGSAGSGTVAVSDDDLPPPVVTIAAKAASVAEGGDAVFTLTVDRAADADLTVTLAVSETGDGDHVAAADEGPATLAIPKGATEAAFTLATVNDDVDEPDGAVTVAVTACAGCTVGDPASASVEVTDDDAAALPVLSVGDATLTEGVEWLMPFTVRLSAAAPETVTVRVDTRDSTPVSATRRDYWPVKGRTVTFRPGETERTVTVLVYDDYHDEGPETFEVVLSDARGAAIGDGVAVGTIVNDDPLPGAWLARFGRTVAEQALDGIAARMAAPRTAGMQGSIAGQALAFGGGAADGVDLSRSPGPVSPGSLSGAGFGQEAQARGMTMREVLQGSSFSLTGEADSSGGTLAFWGGTPGSGGLVSGSRFAGDPGSGSGAGGTAVSLHGETATALLGTDYARGRWLVGFALSETRAEGGYAGEGGSGGPDCSGLPAEACAVAARAGDGEIAASLTATVPYAALAVTDRLRLWGAAGQGAGDVTVKTGSGESLSADTAWSMAAAGLRGDLLAPSSGGTGPLLSLTSDALWVRTSSEKTHGLAASESDVSRLRVGLEGSWGVVLENGGAVTPKLELGARHDGGDAETGFGVELGGGLEWTDPGVGLSLDLSGRTLVAHDDGGLEDRGVSAQLSFDPAPSSGRGLSLGLGQDWGGRASGGLDALFAPEPLEDRGEGNSEAVSRWSMEAAYGLPAFGGRFTGSPYMGFGLAAGARDYSLGWRLAPEAAGAPDLSFGLHATLRESDAAAPEHTVGVELTARW